MNITNMNKLIEFLEQLPEEQFDMKEWYIEGNCGSVACIAGWAYELSGITDDRKLYLVAQEFLGLTDNQRTNLFLGNWANKKLGDITRQEAIDHLKELVAARVALTVPDHQL